MKGIKTMSLANGTSKRFQVDDLSVSNIHGLKELKTHDDFDLVLQFKELKTKMSEMEKLLTAKTVPVVSVGPTDSKSKSVVSDMKDVDLTGLEDGSVLIWNADKKKWVTAKLE